VTREEFRNYCLAKKGAVEDFPFDAGTVVFKISGKIFALADADAFTRISLKCDPDKAIELRNRYPAVIPGYYLNKRLWNTIALDGSLPDSLIRSLIDHSYERVYSGLNRAEKQNVADW
jgi:predicted DNA-binding protein (MmcQ/YjbR family)